MAENKSVMDVDRRNTDLAEGELETVEESIRIHEGKRPPAQAPKHADPGLKSEDLAEGERETIEESIRIHEKKGDVQGRRA